MENKKTFKCILDGVEKEFEVLYTFKSIKYNKDYVIYTDNSYDENNNLSIFASIYYPFNLEKELENIESEEEWNEIEIFLEEVSGDTNG